MILSTPVHSVPLYASAYRDHGYALIPKLLTCEAADEVCGRAEAFASRRVCVNQDTSVFWTQQTPAESDMIYAYMKSDTIIRLVAGILSLPKVPQIEYILCWINKYIDDEHVKPHYDVAGTIQLIVCIKPPLTKEMGGSLMLRNSAADTEIFLEKGDAIIFDATKTMHYTKKMFEVPFSMRRERITLTARYYF